MAECKLMSQINYTFIEFDGCVGCIEMVLLFEQLNHASKSEPKYQYIFFVQSGKVDFAKGLCKIDIKIFE